MKILAVTLEKCSGCALMINNKITFSTSEERYSRIKSDSSFPIEAITHALEFANIEGKDLDQVIICGNMLSLIPSLTNEYSTISVDEQLKLMGKEFIQLTGNDDNALEFNRRGGIGSISVTANIAPKLCSNFQKASTLQSDKDKEEATKLDSVLQPIHNSMFIESNPSPVKYAAKLLGLCGDDVRLPLVKVTEATKEVVRKALVSANLL